MNLGPLSHPSSTLFLLLTLLLVFSLVGCEVEEGPVIHEPQDQSILVVGDATLTAFDIETGEQVGQWGLGNAPNAIAVHEATDDVYVLNSLSHTLQRFRENGLALTPAGQLDLGLAHNRSPYDLSIQGDSAYVSNLLANTVTVIDLNDWALVDEWPVGRAPEGLVAHGDWLHVVNSGYDFSDFSFHTGSLMTLDLHTGEVRNTLELGMNPQFIRAASSQLMISCTGNYGDTGGEMWVTTAGVTPSVSATQTVSAPVGRMTTVYRGRFPVAAGGWSSDGTAGGLVLLVDGQLDAPPDSLHTGLGVVDVAAEWMRDWLVVACREAMRVEVYDDAGALSHTIPLVDPPNAVLVWP